ncbi:MAG: sigma-54-dependent Fis family transcriptional regulator [Pirellulaceae bacterium]|nr:MAG: sigma-54-dependent Fis family transcriptional regulator [Pirellulaceae bacterium]
MTSSAGHDKGRANLSPAQAAYHWAASLWQDGPTLFEDADRFVELAVERAYHLLGLKGIAFVVQRASAWHPRSILGQVAVCDEAAIGRVCVDEKPGREGSLWIIPVRWHSPAALVLEPSQVRIDEETAQSLQRLWKAAAPSVLFAAATSRRCRQAEALLEAVAHWQATRKTDELLQRIAETATQVLDAERASIFLWDRANRLLVAKPALGVQGGELRLPDDRGVVGQVVQTGQARRVNIDEDQSLIDRTVDRKLRFRTHSLLCVPLVGRDGALLGAFEMINKRGGVFTEDDQRALEQLARHASLALENSQHVEQLLRTRNEWANQAVQGAVLLGEHPSIVELRETIARVAQTDLAVLLLGENGTGKEVVCRMIHAHSRRRDEPLVAVNCAALPESLLESELFGHEQGAFTDARQAKPGKFEVAGAGTLFLDEIGEMSLAGQAKLLRAIEEKRITRVGGTVPIAVQARIIAATNRDLAQRVREGRFREDLYYRLKVVALRLPPLRERGDDVILLARHFLENFCRQAGRPPIQLSRRACRLLAQHSWPGNVRELRNLMERFAYLHPRDTVEDSDLERLLEMPPSPSTDAQSLQAATRAFQIRYISEQLRRTGSVSAAARALGMHRANLHRKMRQLGIPTSAPNGPMKDASS